MIFPDLLLGWLLGLLTAFLTIVVQHSLEQKANRTQLAAALAAELEALYDRYRTAGGDLLNQATEWKQFPFTFDPHQNYFIVFDSNASNLGSLERAHSEQLVSFYVRSKGFFDNLINYKGVLESGDPARLNFAFEWLQRDHKHLSEELPTILSMLRSYVR